MADPISAASAADKDLNEANVIDNVNDVTPDPATPPVPVVDKTPTPRPDKEGMDAAGDIASGAGNKVAELEALVVKMGETLEKVVVNLTANKDDGGVPEPTRVPWTHFGSKEKK